MNYELIIEIVAVITGLLSVWFSKKINVLVFPVGMISVLLYVLIFVRNGFYANAGINFIYFLISVFGWWNWVRERTKDKRQKTKDELKVTFLNRKERIISALIVTSSFFIISITFDSNLVTKLDYCTSVLGLGGIVFTSFKKVDNWIFYLLADIILIPLCIYNELYLTSIQYLVYSILAIMGYISWSKEARQNA